MCVCVLCLSEDWAGRQHRRRETAERESELLLPVIPHVALLPFKHHKQASGVMSRSEGGWRRGCRVRENAERKHNSNRNQLEPSKLFICQMDTFPRDFTLKHSHWAPRTRRSRLSKRQCRDNITLSKPFHVWFISSLKSGSPSTPWSHVCSLPQAQGRRNMFSFLYLQRHRHRNDLLWRILYKSDGPKRHMSYTVYHRCVQTRDATTWKMSFFFFSDPWLLKLLPCMLNNGGKAN